MSYITFTVQSDSMLTLLIFHCTCPMGVFYGIFQDVALLVQLYVGANTFVIR